MIVSDPSELVVVRFFNLAWCSKHPTCEFTAIAGDAFTLLCGLVLSDEDDELVAVEVNGHRIYEGPSTSALLDRAEELGITFPVPESLQ